MAGKNIAAGVEELTQPLAEALGLELVDVEFVKEGNQYFLRIFIDKPEGINLDDCEALSRCLDPVLDENDPIPYAYRLEVSSPGLERPLKKPADFVRFQGAKVQVSTFAPLNGTKKHRGILLRVEEQGICLETENGELQIDFKQLAKANLEADF